jgi:putative iron-only hydrogenase system regulator
VFILEVSMENRIAMIGIVVEEERSAESLNHLLSEYKQYVVGRMGIPYRQRGINLISIVLDAPGDAISSLSGKLGQLPGISAKTLYAKLPENSQ